MLQRDTEASPHYTQFRAMASKRDSSNDSNIQTQFQTTSASTNAGGITITPGITAIPSSMHTPISQNHQFVASHSIDLEIRSRRTPVKNTSINVYSQHSVERELNGSKGLTMPQIKDLNQERMLLRMKSHTIHSEQSSPNPGSGSFAFAAAAAAATASVTNDPSFISNNNFSEELPGFARDNSLQFRQEQNQQQQSQQSSMYVHQRNPYHQQQQRESSLPLIRNINGEQSARSKSREKELVQSSNLNSLELDWCRMKRDHNFDNRSQSPFKHFHPQPQPSQMLLLNHQAQTQSQYLNSNSSCNNAFSNNFLDSQSSANKRDNSINSDISLDQKRLHGVSGSSVDSQHQSSGLSRSSRLMSGNNNGSHSGSKNETQSGLIGATSSSKGSFITGNNTNLTSTATDRSKQKTLIKRSVPLSKINLDQVKTNSISSNRSNAHLNSRTPKSASLSSAKTNSTSISQQSQQQGSSFQLNNNNTTGTPSTSSSRRQLSNTNCQNNSKNDQKDETHFQNILDKYSNVHKKPQANNQSSSSATSSPALLHNQNQQFQQHQQLNSNGFSQSQLNSSYQSTNSQVNQFQQQSYPVMSTIERGNSLELFDVKRTSFIDQQFAIPSLQSQQSSSSAINNQTNFFGFQPGNKANMVDEQKDHRDVFSFSSRSAQNAMHLNNNSNICNNSQISSVMTTSNPSLSKSLIPQLTAPSNSSSSSSNTNSISNSIKVKSPKQNDLKVLATKIPTILLKQHSAEYASMSGVSTGFGSIPDSSPINGMTSKSSFSEFDNASGASSCSNYSSHGYFSGNSNNANNCFTYSLTRERILQQQHQQQLIQQQQQQQQQPQNSNYSQIGSAQDNNIVLQQNQTIHQNERNVKQLIMSKINKMNIAKIFLKEDEVSSLSSQNNISVTPQEDENTFSQPVQQLSQQQQFLPQSLGVHQRRSSKSDSTPLLPSLTGIQTQQNILPNLSWKTTNISPSHRMQSEMNTQQQQLLNSSMLVPNVPALSTSQIIPQNQNYSTNQNQNYNSRELSHGTRTSLNPRGGPLPNLSQTSIVTSQINNQATKERSNSEQMRLQGSSSQQLQQQTWQQQQPTNPNILTTLKSSHLEGNQQCNTSNYSNLPNNLSFIEPQNQNYLQGNNNNNFSVLKENQYFMNQQPNNHDLNKCGSTIGMTQNINSTTDKKQATTTHNATTFQSNSLNQNGLACNSNPTLHTQSYQRINALQANQNVNRQVMNERNEYIGKQSQSQQQQQSQHQLVTAPSLYQNNQNPQNQLYQVVYYSQIENQPNYIGSQSKGGQEDYQMRSISPASAVKSGNLKQNMINKQNGISIGLLNTQQQQQLQCQSHSAFTMVSDQNVPTMIGNSSSNCKNITPGVKSSRTAAGTPLIGTNTSNSNTNMNQTNYNSLGKTNNNLNIIPGNTQLKQAQQTLPVTSQKSHNEAGAVNNNQQTSYLFGINSKTADTNINLKKSAISTVDQNTSTTSKLRKIGSLFGL